LSIVQSRDPAKTKAEPTYWLTRFVMLRLLGFVYAVAFLVAGQQLLPLIGSNGLLPVGPFLDRVRDTAHGSFTSAVLHLPSVFWFSHSDSALMAAAWIGFILACLVVAGLTNALIMVLMWALYMSIVHVGQDWYSFGWEFQLLETGFLGIFLCPLFEFRPFPKYEPPLVVIWLFRWLIFRMMLGAGLIKIRGDPVWRDFSALFYHFETQPLPNPLSRWFHFLPRPVLQFGVFYNHLAELVAPWMVFWPRVVRHASGLIIVLFQIVLILSGNLSFLNWVTLVPALACFDDSIWSRILPGFLVRRSVHERTAARAGRASQILTWILASVIGVLSIQPVLNLLSPRQIMNTTFDPLDLVNTYGAFGTVGRERYNVVFEGTLSDFPATDADWRPYHYRALPVDPDQQPVQIAPYQPHLDWQMWFASMGTPEEYPWTVHLVWKLLHNDPLALQLFADNPFPESPPHFVRAVLYRYQFADPRNPSHHWWTRERLGLWLPALWDGDPQLTDFLRQAGWE
jgi:hypothetical protein